MDSSVLFLSLFFSTVGLVYFLYGRRRPSAPFMVVGVVLMIFSYFMSSFWLALAVGLVLAAAPFFVR